MSNVVVVAVSPFYNGRGWTDSATGLSFEPKAYLHPTRISKEKDLTGIQNSVRMNNLLLLEGSFDEPLTEASIEHLNPEELSKEQFDVLVGRLQSSGDDGVSQTDVDAVIAEKEQVEATLAGVQDELASVKAENESLKAQLEAGTEPESGIQTMSTFSAPVEPEEEPVAEEQPLTEEELNALTIAQLKERLDKKGISYSKENKAGLIELLLNAQ